MPGDILDTIDNALQDWSASCDAMRWNPEPVRVICDGGRLWPERWSALRHGAYRYTISPCDYSAAGDDAAAISSALSAAQSGGTGLVTPAFEPWAAIEYRETVTGPQEWTVFFDRDEISTQIAEAFGFTWKRGQIHYHRADASPRARRRCPLCNPRTGPRKLPIDGHAYARRRAARKRR